MDKDYIFRKCKFASDSDKQSIKYKSYRLRNNIAVTNFRNKQKRIEQEKNEYSKELENKILILEQEKLELLNKLNKLNNMNNK